MEYDSIIPCCRTRLLSPEEVGRYWISIKPFIERVLERTAGEMGIEDAKVDILASRLQVWIREEEGEVTGVLTTMLREYPGKRVLVLLHGAGKLEDGLAVLPEVEEWGRTLRVDSLMIWGRKGWEKVLSSYGFDYRYTCMEKRLWADQAEAQRSV